MRQSDLTMFRIGRVSAGFLLASLVTAGCAAKKQVLTSEQEIAPVPAPATATREDAIAPVAPAPAVADAADAADAADETGVVAPLAFPVVSFEFDSDLLTEEGRTNLDAFAARWQARHEQHGLLIEGHADERGLEEYNLVLGQKRASSVRRYLSRLGCPEEALRTISYGENRPVDPARSEAAFAKNRRAQLKEIAQ